MGSNGIVQPSPLLDEDDRLGQRVEDLAVQELVPQLAVEARRPWLAQHPTRAPLAHPEPLVRLVRVVARARGRSRDRSEDASGVPIIEYRDGGVRKRVSLGQRDRERAKQEADLSAAKLRSAGDLRTKTPRSRTLGELFDMYLDEVTPTKTATTRKHDKFCPPSLRPFQNQLVSLEPE